MFGLRRKRYAMAIDTRRCVGCQSCVLACKAENDVPAGAQRSWIRTETTGTYPDLAMTIYSERCMHCANAPCVAACPTGASHEGAGGAILVDRDLCTGCKACVASCPYDARSIHPAGYAEKCTFCMHRVERGLDPACAANCPTRAITFGDANDPASPLASLLRSRRWTTLRPEMGTEPNLYFLL
ncbi:MAG TPA: 4Fe-4S dicluster domain-containing protein [Thermoanaerobaculia bacterium]|nr:4Fe-4S dicluster domain-containing protein [Thermoanaerobaculia bacterium]